MITKEIPKGRAALRALKQPLWDQVSYTNAAAIGGSTRQFFQAPQGGQLQGAGVATVKNAAMTNMLQSSSLGRPQSFDIYGFCVEILGNHDEPPEMSADIFNLYNAGLFRFFFGQQRPWLETPLTDIPTGCALEGTVSSAAAVANGAQWLHNGCGSGKAMYNFTIGRQPIPVGSVENFNAQLSYPTTAAAVVVASTDDIQIRCYMKGILFAAL